MTIVQPSTEDLFGETVVRERLSAFLTHCNGALTQVESLKRFTVGFSWMTYGFIAAWSAPTGPQRQKLVLRIGPPSGLFAPYRASPEFTVLRALQGGAVPVPRAFYFSDASDVLEVLFLSVSMSRARRHCPGLRRVERLSSPHCAHTWQNSLSLRWRHCTGSTGTALRWPGWPGT